MGAPSFFFYEPDVTSLLVFAVREKQKNKNKNKKKQKTKQNKKTRVKSIFAL